MNIPCSWVGRLRIIKISVLSKLIYKFSVVPVKFLAKFLWSSKTSRAEEPGRPSQCCRGRRCGGDRRDLTGAAAGPFTNLRVQSSVTLARGKTGTAGRRLVHPRRDPRGAVNHWAGNRSISHWAVLHDCLWTKSVILILCLRFFLEFGAHTPAACPTLSR